MRKEADPIRALIGIHPRRKCAAEEVSLRGQQLEPALSSLLMVPVRVAATGTILRPPC